MDEDFISQGNAKQTENSLSDFVIKSVENLNLPCLQNYSIIDVSQLKLGLSNILFKVTLQDSTDKHTAQIFYKKFGVLSQLKLINRTFETDIILVLAKENLYPKIIATDYMVYRIEEYLEQVSNPPESVLLEDDFLSKIIQLIINFETIIEYEFSITYRTTQTVWNYLDRVISIAKQMYSQFKSELDYALTFPQNHDHSAFHLENLDIIKSYLDNNSEVISTVYLKELAEDSMLVISHNDIHKNNLLLTHSGMLLIDYEYSSFNYVGFDIVNYFIESFFDLEYQQYPFYRLVKDPMTLFNDEKYYQWYLTYVEILVEKVEKYRSVASLLKSKRYYYKVVGLCSLFWFYSALVFLDFNSNFIKTGMNYVDYAVNRLQFYECSKMILDK